MTVETLVAEIMAANSEMEVRDEDVLAVRHDLTVETVRVTLSNLATGAMLGSLGALYWVTLDHHDTPTNPDARRPTPDPRVPDRSPRSLAVLLAEAAERVRTDPLTYFEDGAVRAAAAVLRDRLHGRLADVARAAKDATEGS